MSDERTMERAAKSLIDRRRLVLNLFLLSGLAAVLAACKHLGTPGRTGDEETEGGGY